MWLGTHAMTVGPARAVHAGLRCSCSRWGWASSDGGRSRPRVRDARQAAGLVAQPLGRSVAPSSRGAGASGPRVRGIQLLVGAGSLGHSWKSAPTSGWARHGRSRSAGARRVRARARAVGVLHDSRARRWCGSGSGPVRRCCSGSRRCGGSRPAPVVSWAWRALAALVPVASGRWSGRLGGRGGSRCCARGCHQAVVLARVALRVSWLARALRAADAAGPSLPLRSAEDAPPGGRSGEPCGTCDEPRGKRDEPRGKRDEPRGKRDEPRGKRDESRGKRDELPAASATSLAARATSRGLGSPGGGLGSPSRLPDAVRRSWEAEGSMVPRPAGPRDGERWRPGSRVEPFPRRARSPRRPRTLGHAEPGAWGAEPTARDDTPRRLHGAPESRARRVEALPGPARVAGWRANVSGRRASVPSGERRASS